MILGIVLLCYHFIVLVKFTSVLTHHANIMNADSEARHLAWKSDWIPLIAFAGSNAC